MLNGLRACTLALNSSCLAYRAILRPGTDTTVTSDGLWECANLARVPHFYHLSSTITTPEPLSFAEVMTLLMGITLVMSPPSCVPLLPEICCMLSCLVSHLHDVFLLSRLSL